MAQHGSEAGQAGGPLVGAGEADGDRTVRGPEKEQRETSERLGPWVMCRVSISRGLRLESPLSLFGKSW